MADSALQGCPFCQIVTGQTHPEIVYEDETVVAFLCEPPASWGHALVVPREHRRDIWEIERHEAEAAMAAARLLAAVMRAELGAVGVNLRQHSGRRAGQDVFHFHLHVVPRYKDDRILPGCVWGIPPWEPRPEETASAAGWRLRFAAGSVHLTPAARPTDPEGGARGLKAGPGRRPC